VRGTQGDRLCVGVLTLCLAPLLLLLLLLLLDPVCGLLL
jgi:hypothetical protein